MTGLYGVVYDPALIDSAALGALRDDHVTRFKAPPKTVMINPMGEGDQWLVVDSTYPAQIERRLEIIQEKRDWVLDRVPGDDVRAAEYELRDAVVSFMTQTYPSNFCMDGSKLVCTLSGLSIDVGPYGADPLVATALIASEDLLLMVPDGQDEKGNRLYPLKSGALVFPNGWSLRSQFNEPEPKPRRSLLHRAWCEARTDSMISARLGKTTYQIHNGRVRHFMENYATRVDVFFNNMPPNTIYWRRNWSPALSTNLFRHADGPFPPAPEFTPQLWADRGHIRSEHETFIKLPETGAVVFGIKTYIWPMEKIAKNGEALSALKTAFDSMEKTPSMWEYREETLPSFGRYLCTLPGPRV